MPYWAVRLLTSYDIFKLDKTLIWFWGLVGYHTSLTHGGPRFEPT